MEMVTDWAAIDPCASSTWTRYVSLMDWPSLSDWAAALFSV